MKYIVSGYLWVVAVLVLIIFLVWFLIVNLFFSHGTYIKWVRSFLKFYFWVLFIKVKVTGTENIDPDKTYVFMSNHVSMFDIPLVLGYIPVNFWGIQASSHFKVPLFGQVLRSYGNIPIDRSSPRASYRTMKVAIEHLKSGKNILIFPEGTRSKKPKMGSFKKLPFVMTKEAGVNIMPFTMSGLWKINNKVSQMIRPGTVSIHFNEEIPADLVNSSSEEDMMKLTKERMQSSITAP